MAEWKGASEKQKQKWKEARQEKEAASRERIEKLLASFEDNPENITEYLRFASRFPKYSSRNTMLIYAQNPHAVFVQSFQAWKEKENAHVKKGEHGLSVFVPVTNVIKLSKICQRSSAINRPCVEMIGRFCQLSEAL